MGVPPLDKLRLRLDILCKLLDFLNEALNAYSYSSLESGSSFITKTENKSKGMNFAKNPTTSDREPTVIQNKC